MLIRLNIVFLNPQPKFIFPIALQHTKTHTDTCPTTKPRKVCPGARGLVKIRESTPVQINRGPVCTQKSAGNAGGDISKEGTGIKRAKIPGKCRMGFIPEEWFRFLRPMTGVSGPYILMLGLANYVVSKEILVMEHEYYLGLSVAPVLYFATTRLGPKIATALDKEVDAIANELEEGRNKELDINRKQIKDAETAIWRAQGQKGLMEVKKEKIALQLEAIYRERLMMVYHRVRGRMDYHVKRQNKEYRVKQKWMVHWILENVDKSITPEFKRQVMEIAIKELSAMADRRPK